MEFPKQYGHFQQFHSEYNDYISKFDGVRGEYACGKYITCIRKEYSKRFLVGFSYDGETLEEKEYFDTVEKAWERAKKWMDKNKLRALLTRGINL